MKKVLLFLSLSLAALGPAAAATDDDLRKAIVGTWGEADGCLAGELVFNSDGTFASKNGSDADTAQTGKYQINDAKLTGAADDGTAMPELTVVLEGTTVYLENPDGGKQQLYPCTK